MACVGSMMSKITSKVWKLNCTVWLKCANIVENMVSERKRNPVLSMLARMFDES